MMSFLRNSNKGFYASCFVCVMMALFGAVSCTNSDDLFGNDMIPPTHEMKSSIDSSVVVNTYIEKVDSMDTHRAYNANPFMGSYLDPQVGRTDVRLFANFSPDGFEHEIEFNYFGENPVIDSMTYAIVFSDMVGDASLGVWIDVYEVENYIFNQDSPYFSNFDMSEYIGDDPLFSFKQYGAAMALGVVPIEFAERLLDNRHSADNIYYSDTTFHKKFPGLYFALREPVTSGDGHVFQIDFSQSAMYLKYENNEADSLEQKMWFLGERTDDYISFSTIKHDYALSDPAQAGVIEAEIGSRAKPSEYLYVQGLSGLMGELVIDSLSLDDLVKRVKAKGYNHIALNRAELQVKMFDAGIEQYEKSFTSLGIYYDMLNYDFLTEYNPLWLDDNPGSTAPLGGAINRSQGVYKFDITSYVQKILTGRESRYNVELQTLWHNRDNPERSCVYGTDSPYPPKLILTYTMIK